MFAADWSLSTRPIDDSSALPLIVALPPPSPVMENYVLTYPAAGTSVPTTTRAKPARPRTPTPSRAPSQPLVPSSRAGAGTPVPARPDALAGTLVAPLAVPPVAALVTPDVARAAAIVPEPVAPEPIVPVPTAPEPTAPIVAPADCTIINTGGDVMSWVRPVACALKAQFGVTILGRRPTGMTTNHPDGVAIDVMIGTNTALGQQIADCAQRNFIAWNLTDVIWNQQYLGSADGSFTAMEDRGSVTANHKDHVHLSFARQANAPSSLGC